VEELVRCWLMLSSFLKGLGFFFSIFVFLVLSIILLQSFLEKPFYYSINSVSFKGYINILTDKVFLVSLLNTFIISLLMLLTIPISIFLSIAIHKINIYGSKYLEPIILAPMFISPLVWGFAWIYAYGRTGLLPNLFGELYGIIPTGIIAALAYVPHAYSIISSSILNIDSSYEEVARIHGASILRMTFRILLPLLRPAIIYTSILLIILGAEQFGIPLLFLSTIGQDTITTYIYKLQTSSIFPPYTEQAVLSSILIYITSSLIILQRYLTLRLSKKYVTISSRGRGVNIYTVRTFHRIIITIAVLLYIIFVIMIPIISIVIRSLGGAYGIVSFTPEFYKIIFTSEYHRNIVLRTLMIAILTATLGVLVYTGYSIEIARSYSKNLSRYFEFVATLPRSIPSIILGLAFLWIYLFTPLRTLVSTPLALSVAYITAYSFVSTRPIVSSLIQISPELEEVARIHGASRSKTIDKIILPLIKRSLIVSWLILFAYCMRDYSIAIFISFPQTFVIGAYLIFAYGSGEMGLISAMSSIVILIALITSFILFKIGWKPYG
jgi:iron(III) transport system permease protein